MALNTVDATQIESGPSKIYYAPLLTTIPTITAVASKVVATPAWTSWVNPGATDGGVTYTESVSTSDITVAESLYPVRTVTTGKSGRVAFNLSHISDLNWKLAMNGGTNTVTGATTTKLSSYVPPLIGSEVRVMLAIQSLLDDEIIVWPQVFNVGSVEYSRGAYDSKAGLPIEFNVELPDPAVMTTPYRRWTTGPLSQG
jgi:hypothetical protein